MGTYFAGRAIRQNAQIAFFWVTQFGVNPVDPIFFWDRQFRATLLRLVQTEPPISGEGESLRCCEGSNIDPAFRPFVRAKDNQVVSEDAVAAGDKPFLPCLLQNSDRPTLWSVNRVEAHYRTVNPYESNGTC